MRVNIVNYESIGWILTKFVMKLKDELEKLGIEVNVAKRPDSRYDINHHIIYLDFDSRSTIDTLMVTHVDMIFKMRLLREKSSQFDMAICMSRDTASKLVNFGVPREQVCYVNPAHDCIVPPRKISIGLLTNLYPDGRKNENVLFQLLHNIDLEYIKFVIMGTGWEDVVKELKAKGCEVLLHNNFDYDQYSKIFSELDYYLYLGMDDGSMAYLDALYAGLPTIVTAQGYHLDSGTEITHPMDSPKNLSKILEKLIDERKSRRKAISGWTWENYALDHISIWNYLLKRQYKTIEHDLAKGRIDIEKQLKESFKIKNRTKINYLYKLGSNSIRHRIALIRNIIK
jgi:hypothetical protein